jgi:hypothetical protein
MASIFTFDPDPPRVSSPWSTPRAATPKQLPVSNPEPLDSSESALQITHLKAEPQEGPTEYKLHLLLRRRRSFVSCSTGGKISGSQRSLSTSASNSPRLAGSPLSRTPSQQTATNQHRHLRLEQLTTQLFWRLQQSAPHHSSSFPKTTTPSFPPEVPVDIGRSVSGLEESKGALYEIGVADDGTLVGLAEDEMEESINTLRIMAASLGCTVTVLRMVQVGECSWLEIDGILRHGNLFVAEAYVKPNVGHEQRAPEEEDINPTLKQQGTKEHPEEVTAGTAEQLRVSLTGSTMSGKSSLLGSLTTATLDNGRGKSRLSLLKHRHEIASGMTSSVTQELIGYGETSNLDGGSDIDVINYASGNISSWTDIHALSNNGRLVLLSDSAGHPRYRRTTVRGLIGWAPHWTILCIRKSRHSKVGTLQHG